jgi:hypothetical protein
MTVRVEAAPLRRRLDSHGVRPGLRTHMDNRGRLEASRVLEATGGIVTGADRDYALAVLDAVARTCGIEIEVAGVFYLLAEAGCAGCTPPPITGAEIEP